MASRLLLLLLAVLTGLLAGPVLAQEGGKKDDGGKGTAERWKELDGKTREERRKILRKLLEGKTNKEKEEILQKLKELERKGKHRRYVDFKERLLKSLSAPARDRYDKLAPSYRLGLVFHSMRRVMEVGRERFMKALSPEERAELRGLRGREHWRKVMEITDRRVVEAQTLEKRKKLDAMPEKERKREIEALRTGWLEKEVSEIETKVVFPEIALLLRKPKAEVEKFVENHQPKRPTDRRPHHRIRMRLDKELHQLLHDVPEKHWKSVDDEIREISKIRDKAARKKSLDDLKARLQKLLAD